MAKEILYVEQSVLDILCGREGLHPQRYETRECYYLPLSDRPKIEIVSSPRPVPRDHLRRDFQSTIDDIETAVRHLKYMKSEI